MQEGLPTFYVLFISFWYVVHLYSWKTPDGSSVLAIACALSYNSIIVQESVQVWRSRHGSGCVLDVSQGFTGILG